MQRRQRHGFTLIELLVVIAIIALLIGILLPALGEAKRQGKLAQALSNQHQYATATGTYAADYQDRMWAFTWRAGHKESKYPDLNNATTDMQAAADQAVDILRRRADREDIPKITGWIPHVYYTHLVLNDYLAQRLPEKMVVDPADKHRLNWQIDPRQNFDNGLWLPFQPDPSPTAKRWAYSSSYQVVPASYDRSPVGFRVHQMNSTHYQYYSYGSATILGGTRLGDVQFNELKVLQNDAEQRHFTRRGLFYADQALTARVVVLTYDGSAKTVVTADVNEGWQPNNPTSPSPTVFTYNPRAWEAGTSTGFGQLVKGYYRYTRGGLAGVDFGAPEIDTGQK